MSTKITELETFIMENQIKLDEKTKILKDRIKFIEELKENNVQNNMLDLLNKLNCEEMITHVENLKTQNNHIVEYFRLS